MDAKVIDTKENKGIAQFELKQSRRIETLDLDIHEFVHRETGALHYHLEAENTENVFMVALRTVPMDSTGVAHILEHTALCGSERFPVRDPFFLMIRRSLNTFMNAFTTSDYTAYPFASTNRKDFFNLMDIYLDAVFFSRLDPLDFAQEGHRLEFENPEDEATPLVYRGVVYNEMKGDSSSAVSVLYTELQKHLFPTSTYHYSSGGDPSHIPELRYDELVDFYRSHYNASNAVFMTFGDLPVDELQAFMEEKALNRLSRVDEEVKVSPERRLSETSRVSAPYALDQDSVKGKTHIVMAWLLGENTDLEMLLKCHILSDLLLDTSASPLKRALEEFEYAAASPLCGLEETNHEMSFMCGVEGSDPEHADEVEDLILGVLSRIGEEGIGVERLEAVFHQLELSQREVGGDGMPYGLQLIFSSMSAAIHRGSPIDLLDLDPVIEKLRAEIHDPEFIKKLVHTLLLENKHRVRLVMYPDPELSKSKDDEEKARLAAIKSGMSQAAKEKLVLQAKALKERQSMEENLEVLPKVGLIDIPQSLKIPEGKRHGSGKITRFDAGTNGIVYHQVITSLPKMDFKLVGLLPLYSQILTEVGSGGRDYLDTQLLQHAKTGGLSAFSSIRPMDTNTEDFRAYFTLGSRTLNQQSNELLGLLRETSKTVRFDEYERIRDLVKQIRVRKESNVASNGHTYAMTAASSCLRPVPWINHELSGLKGIDNLKFLDDSLDQQDDLEMFCKNLEELRDCLFQAPRQFLLVGESQENDALADNLSNLWEEQAGSTDIEGFGLDFQPDLKNQAFLTSTPVNYCVSVFNTVPECHEDSPALAVLSAVLRNGYLHQAIREQGGAYGGGATHDSGNGLFRFYSYRDPLLNETFDAFKQSVDWVISSKIDFALVEEAILGIISGIDAPGSPAGEARQAFHNELHGRGADKRRERRSRILDVTEKDVQRVAEKYLTQSSCLALVTSEARRSEISEDFVVTSI
jgi:presequence protease